MKAPSNCYKCNTKFDDSKLMGHKDKICSHFESDTGWWLRIDHHWNFYRTEKTNTIGAFQCPECNKKETEWLEELLND